MTCRFRAFSPFLVLLLLLPGIASPVFAADSETEVPEDLEPRFREFLSRAEMLMTEEEREYFLALEEDYHRGAFMEEFWRERDTFDDTVMNEFRVHYDARADLALSEFSNMVDARSQALVAFGEPYERCLHATKEIEIWIYDEGHPEAIIGSYDDLFPVLLYLPQFKEDGLYVRWLPFMAEARAGESVNRPAQFMPRSRTRLPDVPPIDWCKDGNVAAAMARISARAADENRADPKTMATIEIPEPSREWLASFHSRTTILPPEVAGESEKWLAADLDFAFPGRHQQRTVVQGVLELDREELGAFEGVAGEGHHQLLLLGEVVRENELFERFRYRFEVPSGPGLDDSPPAEVALVFQRYLRPGTFRVVLKLEDLFGRRFARIDREIEVPDVDAEAPTGILTALRQESELYRALIEADAATARGEHSLRLLTPRGVVVTGMERFQTVHVGDYERVVFLLDDQPILAKRHPPYSVELDLGDVPVMHRLRVNGYDAEGHILASDEILLNPGGQRFRVNLSEPQAGRRYRQSLRAAVQVVVPDGEKLERVELFLNEDRVATLYQPPFVQPILLGESDQLAYVRAVAHLADGNTSEDLVFINAPGEVEEVQVNFVELYATVHDREGRFIPDLTEADFKVLEDGERQKARRFEWVENLPLHVALVMDVSASMEDSLEAVSEAARTFVEDVVEPRDRATVIAFNHEPHVRARFTNDTGQLARELEALRSSGGTSLYDSLAFALHYFNGIKGQKALLLLSDGEDESSGFDLDDALEFARRAGVQIYAIGLKEAVTERAARRVLRQFAVETGGRAFFVENLEQLHGIYREIQEELRSQYLFAYQSTSAKDPSDFRVIEVVVEVDGKKVEVRAMRGYYP